jgi:adenosylhomocysteine nucleosidase
MHKSVDYGILTAVPKEMTSYYETCQNSKTCKIGTVEYTVGTLCGKSVALVPVGWGTTCAAAVMTHLIENFKPKGIFFTGTAGGISNSLNQGDIVIGSHAFEIDLYNLITTCKGTPYAEGLVHSFKKETQPDIYSADVHLFEEARKLMPTFQANAIHKAQSISAKAYYSALATGNNFPLRPEDYNFLKQKNVLAYAMEGSAIYQTSWLFNVPSLVIRGISNLYSDDGSVSNIDTSEIQLASSNAAKFVMMLLNHL